MNEMQVNLLKQILIDLDNLKNIKVDIINILRDNFNKSFDFNFDESKDLSFLHKLNINNQNNLLWFFNLKDKKQIRLYDERSEQFFRNEQVRIFQYHNIIRTYLHQKELNYYDIQNDLLFNIKDDVSQSSKLLCECNILSKNQNIEPTIMQNLIDNVSKENNLFSRIYRNIEHIEKDILDNINQTKINSKPLYTTESPFSKPKEDKER